MLLRASEPQACTASPRRISSVDMARIFSKSRSNSEVMPGIISLLLSSLAHYKHTNGVCVGNEKGRGPIPASLLGFLWGPRREDLRTLQGPPGSILRAPTRLSVYGITHPLTVECLL